MPKHIQPKWIDDPEMKGEFSIEDMVVFDRDGQLANVHQMWEATKVQSMVLDEAHSKRLEKLAQSVKVEMDPETGWMLSEMVAALNLSDRYLVKANIFFLQTAFFEFGIREVFRLVFPTTALPPKPNLKKDILEPLKERQVITTIPEAYRIHVLENRDAVRSAFAHGDWKELPNHLANVDLHEVFWGICAYFLEIQENLRTEGFDV